MKELLLADANRLSDSRSEYEATRQQIDRADYKTLTLSEANFYDLVFMEANDSVATNPNAISAIFYQNFLLNLRRIHSESVTAAVHLRWQSARHKVPAAESLRDRCFRLQSSCRQPLKQDSAHPQYRS